MPPSAKAKNKSIGGRKRSIKKKGSIGEAVEAFDDRAIPFSEAEQTRVLCVLWVLHAVVSFRCVPRLLERLNATHGSLFHWVPHFTSVINWTLRIGLG